jgi:hypothetical protein
MWLETFSLDGLKALSNAGTPRLSILIPLEVSGPQAPTNGVRLRDAIHSARDEAYSARGAQGALAQFEKLAGNGRASTDPQEIVKAAREGRVFQLLLAERIPFEGREDDPLNAAALETLLHGGEVFLVPADKMPQHKSLAAAFRF